MIECDERYLIVYVIQLVIVCKCSVKKHVGVFNKVVNNFVGPFFPK